MQKRLFFIALLAIIAISSMAEGLTYLSTSDFKAKVCYYDLASGQQPQWKYIGNKPCLIDFSTTWCGWCKKLHPILEQVAKQYEGKIYVYTGRITLFKYISFFCTLVPAPIFWVEPNNTRI